MSIQKEKRKDGRAVYAVRWTDDAGKHRSRRFDRKVDAERFETEVRRLRQTNDLASLDAGKATLSEFGREWFSTYVKPHRQPATQINYAGVWDRHILPRLGHHTLRELCVDPQLIARFHAQMEQAGVGASTRRYTLTVLQGCLQRAVEWNRIPDNPARKIRKPSAPRQREVTPLTPETVEALRAHLIAGGRIRDAVLVSMIAYAGLRPGEALALRWRHVRQRTILVESALTDGARKTTKTGKTRSVDTLAPLADDLALWREHTTNGADADLIFPTADGAAWNADAWDNWSSRIFRPACEAIGIGTFVTGAKRQRLWRAPDGESSGPRPYDLRHSFVSLLIHEGRSVVDVARQAGHSPTMCLTTYAHVMADFDPSDRRSAEQWIYEARNPQLRGSYVSAPLAPESDEQNRGKVLQITGSRCADSNRRPLHYECIFWVSVVLGVASLFL